jgi:hypothetical protein
MPLFGRSSPRDEQRAEEYRDWLQRRNPYAIGSFVLGLFSLIEFGALLIFGVVGIVLGVVALVQLKRVPKETRLAFPDRANKGCDGVGIPKTHGHVLAWLGIVFSVVSLIVAGLLYFRVVGG